MSASRWIGLGAGLCGLAVVTGAFAAHGLDRLLVDSYSDVPDKVVAGQTFRASWKYLQDFKTAAEYQMYHGFALIITGLLKLQWRDRRIDAAAHCFLWGTIVFSGSLYGLVLTGQRWLGAITPIGGVLFIAGWLLLILGTRRLDDSPK